ncbi:MAG TPA: AbrB family transcriptional regulator [Devosia sp.]|nr:AbrB family transcriptional regulator [Devosia sp.]
MHLPLAWMTGAMTACAIAAMFHLPIEVPGWVRPVASVVLGTMLGSTFGPELIVQMGGWLVPALGLLLFLLTATAVSYVYFTAVVKLDPVTALFAGMPGGIVEMVMLGQENGADERTITLVHAARIFLVVLILPFVLRSFNGSAAAAVAITAAPPFAMLDAIWFLAVAAFGVAVGHLFKLPIRYLLGPMLASAFCHGMGWTTFRLPGELVAGTQLVLGAMIGCRFAGADALRILKILLQSVGAAILLLSLTFLFAFAVSHITQQSLFALVLAYSPGGLAEMSLVALSLNIEAAFVVTHHLTRVIVITAGMGPAYALFSKFRAQRRLWRQAK